jgi:hypothetical protein
MSEIVLLDNLAFTAEEIAHNLNYQQICFFKTALMKPFTAFDYVTLIEKTDNVQLRSLMKIVLRIR